MSAWVDAGAAFITAHPQWAGVLVFLVAASEAVVVIGYVLPGTPILLAVGGIVGLGHLPLLPILAWAAAGAVAGDGLSFWLGRRYREELRRRWPFSRYPDLLDRGEAFFARHGAKSVALGRFVPVLKPIIPLVAGVLEMPPGRFYLVNVISALLWSPVHILPGVLVGASLGFLHGTSARLVVVALAVLVAVGLLGWGARVAVSRLAPVLAILHRRAFEWATARPGTLAHRLAAPFDPEHPGTPALLATLAVLVTAALGFLGVLEDVVTRDPLVHADHAISQFVEGLRNPWTDPVMVVVATLGDAAVTVPVALAVLGWLLGARAWRLAGGVAIAFAVSGLAVIGVKALVHAPGPVAASPGFLDAYAFPSGHTAMAATLYGLAGWLVAGARGPRARSLAHAASFGCVVAIATSRVYLGAHWPSDVLAGLALGALVVATIAVLYRHAPRARLHAGGLAASVILVLAAAGTAHALAAYDARVARYLPHATPRLVAAAAWRAGGWRALAARRVDLAGESEEPMRVQWIGGRAAFESRLLAAGWRRPPPWSVASAAGFVEPDTALASLPVFPALHDGRKPVVVLVHDAGAANERWVLRAWRSGFEAVSGRRRLPLLVGSVVRARVVHPVGLLTLVRAVVREAEPPASLLAPLGGVEVVRGAEPGPGWKVRLAGVIEDLAMPHPPQAAQRRYVSMRALAGSRRAMVGTRRAASPRRCASMSSRSAAV